MNSTPLSDPPAAGTMPGGSARSFSAELSQFAVLEFSGPDSEAFLQGQLSCDVKSLAEGRATFGGYCSPRGRLLATFWLARGPAAYFMLLSRSLAASTLQRLKMYVLRSKVSIREGDRALFGIAGDLAVRALGFAFPSEHDTQCWSDGTLALEIPAGRRILVVPRPEADSARERLSATTATSASGDWDSLDIQAGIPMLTEATRDQFIPQMVNLELIGGVSFTKGCYPGQEVVARSQHLGKVKRRMYRARLAALSAAEGPPAAGDEIYGDDLEGQASGMVVTAQASRGGGFDLLVVAQVTSRTQSIVRLRSATGSALLFLHLPYEVT